MIGSLVELVSVDAVYLVEGLTIIYDWFVKNIEILEPILLVREKFDTPPLLSVCQNFGAIPLFARTQTFVVLTAQHHVVPQTPR